MTVEYFGLRGPEDVREAIEDETSHTVIYDGRASVPAMKRAIVDGMKRARNPLVRKMYALAFGYALKGTEKKAIDGTVDGLMDEFGLN